MVPKGQKRRRGIKKLSKKLSTCFMDDPKAGSLMLYINSYYVKMSSTEQIANLGNLFSGKFCHCSDSSISFVTLVSFLPSGTPNEYLEAIQMKALMSENAREQWILVE